jgi:hypothetical protein
MAICKLGTFLWQLDSFCGQLVFFPRFGIFHPEKVGNPDSRQE